MVIRSMIAREKPVAFLPTGNLGCTIFEGVLLDRSENDRLSILVLVLHSAFNTVLAFP